MKRKKTSALDDPSNLNGVQLHKVGCDHILVFPQDGSVEQVDEIALAESLLPADAELVGTLALRTTIASYEANTLRRSPSLATGSRAWTRIAAERFSLSIPTSRWDRRSSEWRCGRWNCRNNSTALGS